MHGLMDVADHQSWRLKPTAANDVQIVLSVLLLSFGSIPMTMNQKGVKSAPKPSDHHIPIDSLSAQQWKQGKEVVMNLMKCLLFQTKKTTPRGVPTPEPQKAQNYWDKACDQNPTKPGCKVYES